MNLLRHMAGIFATVIVMTGVMAGAVAAEPTAHTVTLDIKPQPLDDAINVFAQQSGLQVVFYSGVGKNVTSPRLVGTFTPSTALEKLLANTSLAYEFIDARTIAIVAKPAAGVPATNETASVAQPLLRVVRQSDLARVEKKSEGAASAVEKEEATTAETKGIPEMLVKGNRTSNTDIRRTEDDVQPYMVFDAEEIERAMAPDLESFLKTRLPMNQVRRTEQQNLDSVRGNQSTVDLRGLGADETLILVNGRRMPGVPNVREFYQPDINGIPLAAVERIEVLPSTAGGIYGGGATGGVVNIILKRNYSELDLSARYDGTFAGGGTQRRLDATGGFSFEGGRTHVMMAASYRDAHPLYGGDRDFDAQARALLFANNPQELNGSFSSVHGRTTNITSVSGNDLVLVDGMRSLGSPIAHVPAGYAGPAGDGGAAFLTTAGKYNLEIADDFAGTRRSLLSAPTVRSLAVNMRREFTARLETFVDASRYDNRAVMWWGPESETSVTLPPGANNPFTEAVDLAVPAPGYDLGRLHLGSQSTTEQIAGGLIVHLPREWTVQGEYGWSRSTSIYGPYSRAFLSADGLSALIDGRLDPLSDVNAFPLDFTAYYPDQPGDRTTNFADRLAIHRDATLRLAGPLLDLPGGPLRLSALLENREQYTADQIEIRYFQGTPEPTYAYRANVGARTGSAYAELTAPLVSAANARRGLRGLDLQLSYRYDDTLTRTPEQSSIPIPSPDGPFPDVPFHTNSVTGKQYTLGLRYAPAESLALRTSYGAGILPPSPLQLYESLFPPIYASYFYLSDPKRGGGIIGLSEPSYVEKFSILGNLLLRPEQSRSWSAGAILTPACLPGLRLSVDYTHIEKTDEITTLNYQLYLDLEDHLPDFVVVRDSLTPADEALGYTGGVIRELYMGYINIAHSVVEAYDIQADYLWSTPLGEFTANVAATFQPHLKQQAAVDSEEFDTAGYNGGPLKWRANAGVRWSRGPLSLGWNMQYYDAYRVYTAAASSFSRDDAILSQGSAIIPTQTYHDVFGRYRFPAAPGFARGLLQNAELLISVQNVFNDSPPILAGSGYSPEGDPRLRRYSIALTRRFGR